MLFPLAFIGGARQGLPSPYASRETLRLGAVETPATAPRYGILEVPIDATGTYDDPFDPAQVHLDATLTGPDGRTLSIPGYLDRSYRRTLVDGAERLEPDGPARWRLRLSPQIEGEYNLRVVFADGTGEVARSTSFRCVPSKEHGFVGVSDADRRYFAFSDGKSYWPLGENLAWTGPRGSFDYDDWLAKLGNHGANYVRLWLSPSWTTFAQETPAGGGVGRIDLGDAWRLDHVMDAARQRGIYAMLCLDSYNVLRTKDGSPWWPKTPHNVDNSGPLRVWTQFWTDATMDRLYRNRLRYLVARWGADAHVFAWEFWNEVDLTNDFDALRVREWHQRMAKALDALDAYHHLRTTSVSATAGNRTIDLIPELDLMQTHAYDVPDLAGTVATQQSRKSAWGKPHFFGEIGADSTGPRADDDPDGMQIHDPIWASIATGASGGAMPWWWDTLVAAKDLYGLFDAPSRFLAGVDWSAEGFRQTDVALSMADPSAKPPPSDLVIENGPVSWSPSPGMAAQMAVISKGRLQGEIPAGILHGTVNHPNLHNPLTLRIRVDDPTSFVIAVGTVSGHGGANLRVTLDGRSALAEDFPSAVSATDTRDLRKYAKSYSIPLSAGVHTLRIENTGADWVRVGYRLVGVVPRTKPPLTAWAIAGDHVAMAWIRVAGRTWRTVADGKWNVPPAPPSVFRISGLHSGVWRAEIWDTWAGKILSTTPVQVGIDGGARVLLPRIERDVALKLVRS